MNILMWFLVMHFGLLEFILCEDKLKTVAPQDKAHTRLKAQYKQYQNTYTQVVEMLLLFSFMAILIILMKYLSQYRVCQVQTCILGSYFHLYIVIDFY